MITPSEFLAKANNGTAAEHAHALEQIRVHFDMAIENHDGAHNGHTVRVMPTRADWPSAAIQAVIDEYRAAGWCVDTSNPTYLVQLTASPSR